MATAEQLKSLIRSHFDNEADRFYTIALQVAAHEAKQGHASLANDIKKIIDSEKKLKFKKNIVDFPHDLLGLIYTDDSDISLNSMVFHADLIERINLIIHEQMQKSKLRDFGLEPRRKILLIGPPGTGKTMTAKMLAKELNFPLKTIQMDRLITKFMGESSAKLRQVFDLMQQSPGVYLFDEFDAIGGDRSLDNDVGEMRRILNSFLQFIERDDSESVIISVTNNPNLLDQALYRRFDDVLYYENPDNSLRKELIRNVTGTFASTNTNWDLLLNASDGLSHAEIDLACRDAIKIMILSDKNHVSDEVMVKCFANRKQSQRGNRKK